MSRHPVPTVENAKMPLRMGIAILKYARNVLRQTMKTPGDTLLNEQLGEALNEFELADLNLEQWIKSNSKPS